MNWESTIVMTTISEISVSACLPLPNVLTITCNINLRHILHVFCRITTGKMYGDLIYDLDYYCRFTGATIVFSTIWFVKIFRNEFTISKMPRLSLTNVGIKYYTVYYTLSKGQGYTYIHCNDTNC